MGLRSDCLARAMVASGDYSIRFKRLNVATEEAYRLNHPWSAWALYEYSLPVQLYLAARQRSAQSACLRIIHESILYLASDFQDAW